MTVSAQDAFATRFCVTAGCTLDADPGSDHCSAHQGRRAYGSVTPERLRLAAEVKRLRDDEGFLYREIVARLGISYSYAQGLYVDPEGTKARERKDSYRRPCPECGTPMSGGDGADPALAPERCADCQARRQHEERHWTAERIVETFQRFAEVNGRTPTTTDAMIRSDSVRDKCSPERVAEADEAVARVALPAVSTVQGVFGSWHAACAAAGLKPAPTGGAGHRARISYGRAQRETLAALDDGPARTAEMAQRRECTYEAARAALRGLAEHGLVVSEAGVWRLTTPDDPLPERSTRPMASTREYIVLRRTELGMLSEVATVYAATGDLAIEQTADGAGVYVAVSKAGWQERTVAPVTRLAVTQEAAA